jgi:uncharacterized protein
MDRSTALSILKRYEAELRSLGVRSLSVFGSTACDAANDLFDIDVAVKFAPGPRGLARLKRAELVKSRLSSLLGRSVDVVEEPARSPRLQKAIQESKQGISFNPQLKGQVSDTDLRPVSQLWRHRFRVGGSHRRAGKQGHQLKCHPSNFLPIIVRFNSFLNGEWGLALASRLGSQPLEIAN